MSLRRLLSCAALLLPALAPAAAPAPSLWSRENLQAWCIVPFDAQKRSPEERAEMLARIGLRAYAYDFRAEHVPTFDREIAATKAKGIALTAWWFPGQLDGTARTILATIERHGIRPELWISGGGAPAKSAAEQAARVASEVGRLQPLAEAARQRGCKVALYNHGGWFGDPDNQLAVLDGLRRAGCDNVGLVYNFHHAHEHLRTFAMQWPRMMPHVTAVNLSGLVPDGDRTGRKILYLGEGSEEIALMRVIARSGWRGPVGVLCHRTDVDAEHALRRNLAGLEQLAATLAAEPPAAARK